MPRGGRRFTAQQRVSIVKQHLVEKKALSELCKEHKIDVSTFHRWQKEMFEAAAAALDANSNAAKAAQADKDKKIERLQDRLRRKDEVLAELMEEHVQLKKELGEP